MGNKKMNILGSLWNGFDMGSILVETIVFIFVIYLVFNNYGWSFNYIFVGMILLIIIIKRMTEWKNKLTSHKNQNGK